MYHNLTDIDIAVETKNFEELKAVVNMLVDKIKDAIITCKLKKYCEVVATQTSDFRFSISGIHRKVEVFMVESGPGNIGNFHLPCVRAWYDGVDTYMFPDFVTAAYTNININTHWTSTNKDLRDIVMKYYQRGFGMLLNVKDTQSLINYINASNKWQKWIIPLNGRYWKIRMLKSLAIYETDNTTSNFFNPSVTNLGIHFEIKSKRQDLGLKNAVPKFSRMIRKSNTLSIIAFDKKYIVNKADKKIGILEVYNPYCNPIISNYF